ncbi:DUF4158 domain-containing protein [Legionella pneumophila]|nr:DUF4158 domain-containing protein [Legionella pneumophila]
MWGYRLTHWLYNQAWYGNERPSILFERCTLWLISRKVLLPGISTLTVLIAKVRDRVSKRLWQRLTLLVDINQRQQLKNLLLVPDGKRYSKLDELKNGPTHISSAGLVQALKRYQYIRDLGLGQTNIGNIPKQKLITWPDMSLSHGHHRLHECLMIDALQCCFHLHMFMKSRRLMMH